MKQAGNVVTKEKEKNICLALWFMFKMIMFMFKMIMSATRLMSVTGENVQCLAGCNYFTRSSHITRTSCKNNLCINT